MVLKPTGKKRHALTESMSASWAQAAHRLFVDSLMRAGDWKPSTIAFHGGTSLHLSWQSARYSEDLDFLLSRADTTLKQAMVRTTKLLQEQFRRMDPNFSIEVRDKTKNENRMLVYHVVVSHPMVVGVAMVKAEFWRTEPEYLQHYPTVLRTPMAPGDMASLVSYPAPAATLATAFADKLVAFATRPRLKWRDIYDLWWIGTQSGSILELDAVCEQFQHNIQAYDPVEGLEPHKALLVLLRTSRDELIARADPDLKTWLPPDLWRHLGATGVAQMVDFARVTLQEVHDHIDGASQGASNGSGPAGERP